MKNESIRCNVTKCRHNSEGTSCSLQTISVNNCCGENCTCCGSYDEKNFAL